MGPGSFQTVPSGRTRCNRHRTFHMNMGKSFFTVRVTEHRSRLPGEVVESPSLEIFKSHLDTFLGNLL